MELKTFFDNFETMAGAPNGVQKLREMIWQLAIQGKLVPQDPNDEPASVLLEKVLAEKEILVRQKILSKSRYMPISKEEIEQLDLPLNWGVERLGNIAHTVTKGATPTTYGFQYQEEGIPFIKVENVKNGRITRNGIMQFISLEAHNFQRRSQLIEGDILFSIAGTIGTTCIVYKKDIPSNTNQALAIIRGTKTVFKAEFLRLLLDSYVANKIKDRARGGAMNNVSLGDLKNLVVFVPPANEQHRIVAKIDELMALCDDLEARKQKTRQTCIQLNDACIDKMLTAREPARFNKHWQRIHTNFDLLYSQPENVNKLRQAILQLAVQGKLVPQDPNDEPASVFLEKIRDEKERLIKIGQAPISKPVIPILGSEQPHDLPLKWIFVRLQDFGYFLGGGTPSKQNSKFWEGPIPWISPKDMKLKYIKDSIDHISEEAIEASSVKIIPEQSLLMVVRGMILLHSFPVAITRRVVTINQDMKALVLYDDAMVEYLSLYLEAAKARFLDQVERSSHGTCRIKSDTLFDFVVALPPLNEQRRIVDKVDQLMALCDDLEAKLQKSQKRNDRLMEAAVAEMLAA